VQLFSGFGNLGALYSIYLSTMMLTLLVTNAAAAAMAIPFGLEVAVQLSLPIKSVMYVVMFGASACFLSPVGYQTNLMVSGPGAYTFFDFTRYGTALQLTLLALTPLLAWALFGTHAAPCDDIYRISNAYNTTLCF